MFFKQGFQERQISEDERKTYHGKRDGVGLIMVQRNRISQDAAKLNLWVYLPRLYNDLYKQRRQEKFDKSKKSKEKQLYILYHLDNGNDYIKRVLMCLCV